MSDVKISAARQEQSKNDKRTLLDKLINKERRTREVTIILNGSAETLKFGAISQTALDALRAKHPPTTAQRAEGLGVDTNTFAPALVAATLIEPAITEDEAREMWASDNWAWGELGELFSHATEICSAGFDIPRKASA